MKKLLLLGAILTLGATSFGEVFQLTPGANPNENKYSGQGSLTLEATGSILAVTDTPMLVLTPKGAAGGGNTITFDFDSMVVGQTKTANGEFEAKIIVEKVNTGSGGQKEVITLPVVDGTVTARLAEAGSVGADGTNELTLNLMDMGTTTQIGELKYNLSFAPNTDKTYTGQIAAEVVASGAGTFTNMDGRVEVKVNEYEYNK